MNRPHRWCLPDRYSIIARYIWEIYVKIEKKMIELDLP